ncbi:MAG: hypothetical protein WD232_02390 [Acidimicrobiales bacterium]
MIWLLTRLVVVPVKVTAGGFKLGFWTGRTVGWRRISLLGLGVGIGLLVAPGPGAELRARLRQKVEGPPGQPGRSGPPAWDDGVLVATPPPTDAPVVPPSSQASGVVRGASTPSEPLPAAPDADPATEDPATEDPTTS